MRSQDLRRAHSRPRIVEPRHRQEHERCPPPNRRYIVAFKREILAALGGGYKLHPEALLIPIGRTAIVEIVAAHDGPLRLNPRQLPIAGSPVVGNRGGDLEHHGGRPHPPEGPPPRGGPPGPRTPTRPA